MLKITEQRSAEPVSLSLLLEGRLAGPWVEELNVYCRTMSGGEQQRTTIDLTGVTFIDVEGKALLAQLWSQGAKLRATGCLTRCIVEEITGVSRVDRRMEKGESA
jgi:ABC-type transporter Mla MlaB component